MRFAAHAQLGPRPLPNCLSRPPPLDTAMLSPGLISDTPMTSAQRGPIGHTAGQHDAVSHGHFLGNLLLVGRQHLGHARHDLAPGPPRRPRRPRQPLLYPEARRRPARRTPPLGRLPRPRRGLEGAARVAWLAALHRRHAADRGGLHAPPLAAAAPHEHDRHRRRLSPRRQHRRPRPGARKATGDYKPWRPG